MPNVSGNPDMRLKNMEKNFYRWKKFRNGVGCVAIVDIDLAESSSGQNEIIENYSGEGFTSQGNIESVPAVGYDSWKIAAKHGLEFAFSKIDKKFRVTINDIEGIAILSTNPTTVAYTICRAFFDKTEQPFNEEEIQSLEDFVMSSWTNPYKELIPNFFTRTFTEF